MNQQPSMRCRQLKMRRGSSSRYRSGYTANTGKYTWTHNVKRFAASTLQISFRGHGDVIIDVSTLAGCQRVARSCITSLKIHESRKMPQQTNKMRRDQAERSYLLVVDCRLCTTIGCCWSDAGSNCSKCQETDDPNDSTFGRHSSCSGRCLGLAIGIPLGCAFIAIVVIAIVCYRETIASILKTARRLPMVILHASPNSPRSTSRNEIVAEGQSQADQRDQGHVYTSIRPSISLNEEHILQMPPLPPPPVEGHVGSVDKQSVAEPFSNPSDTQVKRFESTEV